MATVVRTAVVVRNASRFPATLADDNYDDHDDDHNSDQSSNSAANGASGIALGTRIRSGAVNIGC